MMYRRGVAMPADNSRAIYWLVRAKRNGHEQAADDLGSILRQLPKMRLPAATEIRSQPDAKAAVIRTTKEYEFAYELSRPPNWLQVYFEDDSTIGYASAARLRGK